MAFEPKVPLSQRRGTSSEAEIKAILSDFSILAKPEPDIGIDYQCELLKGETPLGKLFGIQVKGRKNVRDKQSISLEKTTINHWLRLPFPVFIIIVDKTTGVCYWISFIDNLGNLLSKMENSCKTVSVKVNELHVLSRGENQNQDFISKVKSDMEMLSLELGHPQFGEGYVRRLPVAYLPSGVRSRLVENIRTSVNCLINHWILENDIEKAYMLCEFLTKLDKAHYDHFYKFGKLNKLLGKKLEAKKAFEEAKRICLGDKNWNLLKEPSDPPIEEIIEIIQTEIDELDSSNSEK